jgi:chloride channel protein, CIC family
MEERLRASLATAWQRILGHATGRWLVLAGAVGVLCGAVGFAFNLGVNLLSALLLGGLVGIDLHQQGARVQGIADAHLHLWLILPVITLGGIAAGWMAGRFAPDAAGGGTGVAVGAFHRHRGFIPFRTTVTKVACSIATLGTGGSAGHEGPIALVGAGFGSWFSDRAGLTARDRRVLLASGIAGGVAAVFHAPLAAAIFAAEVFYRSPELEAEVLIPSFIASIIGFTTCGLLDGTWNSLLGVDIALTASLFSLPPGLGFSSGSWEQLLGYGLIAFALAVAARSFRLVLRTISRRSEAMFAARWLRAGIGALLSGGLTIGLWYSLQIVHPQGGQAATALLGPGYGILQQAFDLHGATWSWAVVLAAVAVAKMLSTSLTVGSGGSGGMFAPSLVIGGCIGGAVGVLLHSLPIGPPIPACILIGMAGFLAATHRTPVAALLMVSEISGTYALLIPAMWGVGLAFLFTGDRTMIGQQVHAPADSPAHEGHFFRDLFAGTKVDDVLDRSLATACLAPGSTLDDCRRVLAETRQTVFPVLDQRRLVGIVTIDDLRGLIYQREVDALIRVVDICAGAAAALRPNDSLARALRRFNQHRLDDLPVVDEHGIFLGLLNRETLFEHYQRRADHLTDESRSEGYRDEHDWRRTTGGL